MKQQGKIESSYPAPPRDYRINDSFHSQRTMYLLLYLVLSPLATTMTNINNSDTEMWNTFKTISSSLHAHSIRSVIDGPAFVSNFHFYLIRSIKMCNLIIVQSLDCMVHGSLVLSSVILGAEVWRKKFKFKSIVSSWRLICTVECAWPREGQLSETYFFSQPIARHALTRSFENRFRRFNLTCEWDFISDCQTK